MLYFTIQLLGALIDTHGKGIIHRDIKPDNIMINSLGEVKITDFGIVHVEEATFTPTGAMLGTPRYMSPEQVTGGKIDGRSDIYSVGILLYELFVGAPPFVTGDIAYQQVNKDPVPLIEVGPDIPLQLNNIVMRCLEKTPDDRFPSAEEARDALDEVLTQLGGCQKYQHDTVDGGKCLTPAGNKRAPMDIGNNVPSSVDDEVPHAIKSNFDSHQPERAPVEAESVESPVEEELRPGPPNPADYFGPNGPEPSAEGSGIKGRESAA